MMTTFLARMDLKAWTIATAVLVLSTMPACGGGSGVPDTSSADAVVGTDDGQPSDSIVDSGADDSRLDTSVQSDTDMADVADVAVGVDVFSDDAQNPADSGADMQTVDAPYFDVDDVGTDLIGPRDDGAGDLWQEPLPEPIMVRFFSEDFEDLADSVIEDGPNYYSTLGNGTIGLFSGDAGLGGSRVLKIVDPAVEGTSPGFLLNFSQLTDELTDDTGFVSFDLNASGDISYMMVRFGQDLTFRVSSLNSESHYTVSVDSDSKYTVCTTTLPKGQWVNFRVEFDWPNMLATLFLDNQATDCTGIQLIANSTPGFPRNILFGTSNRAVVGEDYLYPGGTYMIDNLLFAHLGETGFSRHMTTGQMWQRYPPAQKMSHEEAVDFCAGLEVPRGLVWRLPTIDELRTLVSGCYRTETGGSCGITDSCVSEMDCRTPACDGCGLSEGCYIVGKMDGGCTYPYVSDTLSSQITREAWWLNFRHGWVGAGDERGFVRCVLDYDNGN